MKTIGKILITLALVLFVYGVFSFKIDLDNEHKELLVSVNDEEDKTLFPEQIQKIYKNHYILDGLIIGFGAVSLVVGGLLIRKSS